MDPPSEDTPLDDANTVPAKSDSGIGTGTGTGTSAHQSRIRRRNRMIASCLECRRRKLKCDKLHPCTNCSKFTRDCVFLAPALDSASQMKLTEIKEKMGSLERVLEQDVAKKKKIPSVSKKLTQSKSSVNLPGQDDSSSGQEASVPDDEKDLEPTPLAVADAAFEDDPNDEVLELGVKVGKFRLTERIGGFFRPRMVEELTFGLDDPSIDHRTDEEKASTLPLSPDSAEDFLEPGPAYIAPGAGFLFGNVGPRTSLMDFLPSKLAADTLVDRYLQSVHCIARVIHWPSFQVQYENFWANVLMGIEPTASLQALIFAVMFSAVASMNENEIAATFSRPRRAVLTNFQTGTEVALGKAHFLRTTKMETLQALVIYLVPMCRGEISRAHSVLVGVAIRVGELMGLHRDPADTYGLTPLESHTRRTVWYQLSFLDMRTNEAQGPRPYIRREDFDTKFPFNVNDVDLLSPNPIDSDTAWTDMTFSRMRFECNEMHRVIFNDRTRLDKKQVSLTHILGKIESFRRAMEAKYHPIFNIRVPIQYYGRLVMNILLLRMHISVLHRYHAHASVRIPDRLRQIILTSGTQLSEDAVKLETQPELQQWRWYSGAYQQYTIAFLLLDEITTFPMRKEADRIWDVLDYVFEVDRTLSRPQKSRIINSQLRDRLAVYRDMQKMRAPISLTKRMYQKASQRSGNTTSLDLPTKKSPSTILETKQNLFSNNPSDLLASKTESAPLAGFRTLGADDASGSSQATSSDYRSPSQSADPSFHSWSFDTPATYYLAGREVRSAISPPVDLMGSSPSAVSTSDSWPPFIMQGQDSWRNPLSPGSISLQPQAMSTAGPAPDLPVQAPSGDFKGNRQNPVGADKGDMMMDINWTEWDKIFPPDINTGVLNMPADLDFGTKL